MIISASRRTDIPAFYAEWLSNRIKEGYVLVRNPMNPRQVGRISLSPDVVDGIVFWTKNPTPMMAHLSELEKYTYYFQFTLTAYDRDVEPNIPSKNNVIIPAFQNLAKRIGRDRVVWRYDPIFFNDRYTLDYHCRYFRVMASKLADHTEKCTISFLDLYKKTVRNLRPLNVQDETFEMQYELMQRFSEIAKEYGFCMDTCAETIDLGDLNIQHASCIDKERFERIGKCRLALGKDPNQRAECGCIASIDIGAYDTCQHGCLYCYANYSQNTVKRNTIAHDPNSPLLFGELGEGDVIKERDVRSCKDNRL